MREILGAAIINAAIPDDIQATITSKGLKVLQTWLMEEVELEQGRNELLLKVFFGKLNSISSSIIHVETYKHQIAARKTILDQARKKLLKDYPEDPGLPFWLMTVEFGIRRMQASIEWADYALAKLIKLKKISS